MFVTVHLKVKALIKRLTPDAICNPCIAERLGLEQLETSERLLNELVGLNGFERKIGPCAICGESKKTIRFRSQ